MVSRAPDGGHSTVPEKVGWHCASCNRYFQTRASDPPPAACRFCGAVDTLRRIEHRQPTTDFAVGDVVAVDILGEVETYLVGTVVAIGSGRLQVEARDGTGRYEVKPGQVVGRRRPR